RDPAQSEEVAQEVLLEVWRTASRVDAGKGGAGSWALTMAHRRAVGRGPERDFRHPAGAEVRSGPGHRPRRRGRSGRSQPGRPAGAPLPGRPDRTARRGGPPRLLRGVHVSTGREAAWGGL